MSANKTIEKYDKLLCEMKRRKSIQEGWKARLENLDMSRAAFCEKHDISPSWFCRVVNMKLLAGESVLSKIENALKSEGV